MLLGAVLGLGLTAPERLTLTAEPLQALAPTAALIRAHVTMATTPQRLTLFVEGPHYSSRSEEDIPPNRPYWLRREILRLPEGEYVVEAILTSASAPIHKRLQLVRQ